MVYKVLYRKWRPKIFDDVIAQNHVTDVLKSQIVSNRIPHALMFCGSRGTGKTSCAKIFAKAVNCLNNVDGNPCLECEICKKIDQGEIFDICEIDAASNNGVDNIRSIREESNYVSSKARYKVYIVDEFHMLSSGAFNAFLRTLEEPSKNVIFILATTEFNKIPKTIVSRCQKFDFHRIDNSSMLKRLKFISEKENIDISDDALELICKNSDGAMRDALSILDQCSNFGKVIDLDKLQNLLGISNSRYIDELTDGLLTHDLKKSVYIIENLYEQGNNLTKECEFLMNYFYDVFFYISSGTFLENSINDKKSIADFSSKISLDDSIDCFRILEESYINMSKSMSRKAELEIAIIKMFQRLNKNNNQEKIKDKYEKNNSPKEKGNLLKEQTILQNKQNVLSTEKTNLIDKKVKSEKKIIDNSLIPLDSWKSIVESTQKISKSLFEVLKESKAYIDGDNLLINTNIFAFSLIKKSYSQIESIIREKTGKSYKITRLDSEKKKENNSEKVDLFVDKALKCGIDIKIN